MAGRPGKPAGGGADTASPSDSFPVHQPASEMSEAPPDLTFFHSLGKERPAPTGDAPVGGTGRDGTTAGTRGTSGASTGAFVVQALATRDGQAAGRLRDRLAGRGFPATVTEDRSGARSVYRVRVGRYRERSEAEAAVRVLQKKDHLRPWILQEEE